MDEQKFIDMQNKLNEINNNIIASHNQQYGWTQDLRNRQINIEKHFGISDAAIPFEPHYNLTMPISPEYPEIFNKYGEPMEVFFIRDREFSHQPNSRNSRYIIWDRYNYGLKTHFYTHHEMFKLVGTPERRFGLLLEPSSINPQSYQIVLQNKEYIENNFNAIFTYDARLLSTLKNARLFTSGAVWYGKNIEGGMFYGKQAGFSNDGSAKKNVIVSEDNYKRKTKNISMICSQKEMCRMHVLRKKLALHIKKWGGADTYGKFDGGDYVPMELPFEFYRYSVAVENNIEPYYFTEKICNCFAAETIPIYCGATEIGKFFNTDGIIQISVNDFDHIEDILKNCTPEEYERRLPAIIDNYRRVQYYMNFTIYDRIYMEYLKPNK